MRKFLINVNGNSYEVEVEELGGSVSAPAPKAAPATPAAAPAPKAAPAAPAAAAPAGSTEVKIPMPGTLVSVNVKPGDTVKSGDILAILEAMKMENEIMAPCDGKVISVSLQAGAAVNSGDLLVVIG